MQDETQAYDEEDAPVSIALVQKSLQSVSDEIPLMRASLDTSNKLAAQGRRLNFWHLVVSVVLVISVFIGVGAINSAKDSSKRAQSVSEQIKEITDPAGAYQLRSAAVTSMAIDQLAFKQAVLSVSVDLESNIATSGPAARREVLQAKLDEYRAAIKALDEDIADVQQGKPPRNPTPKVTVLPSS